MNLNKLQELINYQFNNQDLLIEAMTHPSYLQKKANHYERLEFVGDKALSLVLVEYLFINFPHETEGLLAKRLAYLASGITITKISRQLNLHKFARFETHLHHNNINDSIFENLFEALIGAIYLDQKQISSTLKEFIINLWSPYFEHDFFNPKTALQEWTQQQNLPLPHYEFISQTGSSHNPDIILKLHVKTLKSIELLGHNKKNIEKELATLMLEQIKARKPK